MRLLLPRVARQTLLLFDHLARNHQLYHAHDSALLNSSIQLLLCVCYLVSPLLRLVSLAPSEKTLCAPMFSAPLSWSPSSSRSYRLALPSHAHLDALEKSLSECNIASVCASLTVGSSAPFLRPPREQSSIRYITSVTASTSPCLPSIQP